MRRFLTVLVILGTIIAMLPGGQQAKASDVVQVAADRLGRARLFESREVFEDFDEVVYLQPNEVGNYYAIPNGDFVQYFGQQCDPEHTACIKGKESQNGTTYARLKLAYDSSPAGYDNADVAGTPTGYTAGEGDQLWCPTTDHPFVATFRVRWSDEYDESGFSIAAGSNGVGVWNNPFRPEGTSPVTAAFFIWIRGVGLSTMVMKDNVPSFNTVTVPADMNSWGEYRIKIKRLATVDRIIFLVKSNGEFVENNTVELAERFDCTSLEMWNDNQGLDEFGFPVLQELEPGATQHMDVDWYRFKQD